MNTNAGNIRGEDLAIQPIERSETIPSRWYTDPSIGVIEQAGIFASTWQHVGHVSQVARPGDYMTALVAGNPVLLVRGKDNVLRGFFNVCRHRGGPLAVDDQGNCNVLQCKYHGWTYLLDGSLRGVPKWERVDLFDKKDYGLVPVLVEAWEGLLFVNLQNVQPLPLTRIMEGISKRIHPISLQSKKFYKRVTYDVNCNWKVYVDNYLEGYHLPHVHPELCTLLDYQKYVTETREHYSLQYSPFTGKENIYASGDGQAFYYFVFPNFMLNILPNRLQTNVVLPLAHNKTRVSFDYYYDDISSPESLKLMASDLEYSDKIQHEDIVICELVQRGLESMAYDKGRFSVEMEQGVYHFQCMLKRAFRSAITR